MAYSYILVVIFVSVCYRVNDSSWYMTSYVYFNISTCNLSWPLSGLNNSYWITFFWCYW